MNEFRSLKDLLRRWPFRNNRNAWVYGGLCLGFCALVIAVLMFLFAGAILNGYGKGKVERAFAKAYPGSTLQIGELEYTLGTNRLVAKAVTLHATASTLRASQVSVSNAGWFRLLAGMAAHRVLAKASLDATDFEMEFPKSHYKIFCSKVKAAVPASELVVEGMVFQSTIKDEQRFSADAFRTTRFHVAVPECSVTGLAFGDLLQGKSYRAGAIHLSRPSLDALVDRDKPVKTSGEPPLMVDEALAAIGPPMQIDHLSITDGRIDYAERVVPRAKPGVLTFTAVGMDAAGITNRGGGAAAIRLNAQGKLMDAGVLQVRVKIPLSSPVFSLQYAGSLAAMDLTRLNAFLEVAELTRIKSGRVGKVMFDVEVVAGHAHGQVRATYQNLKIAVLDKKTGTEKGLRNRAATFLANLFSIQASSPPGAMKEGKVVYRRRRNDNFIQVLWFSLRSGVLDAIHR